MEKKETGGARPPRVYHHQISDQTSDELYVKILQKLVVEKLYRDPNYSAKELASDLGTSPRYISASIARHTRDNYNALVNHYRLRDACRRLARASYAGYTVEEIGLMSGFSSRQAFYLAFRRVYKGTPLQYRLEHQNSPQDDDE